MMERMKWSPDRSITTVLFDMGGVLASDIYEHVLFDRRYGLAPKGWIARRRWKVAAGPLWDQFAVQSHAGESAFWHIFSERVHSPVDPSKALETERHELRINRDAAWLLPALHAAGIKVGIVSDNTAFWYPQQLAALGLKKSIDPDLILLSYEHGVRKLTGLYAIAAAKTDPTRTLVVEDRPMLRLAARRAGFHTVGYRMSSRRSLAAALRRHGVKVPANPA
jgi:FMN phosphatase YigB (HAD superfamily)